MKKINIIKGLVAMLLMAFVATSCEDVPDLLTDIGADRVFTPIGLTAKVSNQTTVTLNWTPRENTDHYVVDISADDPNFTTIYKTLNVTDAQLPISVVLEGLTKYSIRMKAVSSIGLADSKYDVVTATTLSEQLFLPSVDGDIQATTAILRWVPNSNVTNITLTPGNINHVITASEKTSGVATITGLTGEVTYNASLMNGTKLRGTKTFKTAVDIGDGILIHPTDDLNDKITNAAPGAKLYLEPGEYSVYKGTVTLTKPISIYGLRSYDKPKVHLNFVLENGAGDLKLQDLDLNGDLTSTVSLIQFNKLAASPANFGDILLSGCNIHDFDRSLAGCNVTNTRVNSVKVDNCIVTNVLCNGGEFINFRITNIANISFTKSTFNNCAATDFIRVDAPTGLTGPTAILINACTIYNKKMTRVLYVRNTANSSTISNTLFSEATAAVYANQAATTQPVFSNNNYYKCPGLYTSATNVKIDATSTYTTLDPQFVDPNYATSGNFKVGNSTLIGNQVGDPRWLQ